VNQQNIEPILIIGMIWLIFSINIPTKMFNI